MLLPGGNVSITATSATTPYYLPVRPDWLDRRKEPILEPNLPIVDPHHHLWDRPGWRYLLDELLADTSSGHNILATVFVQARAMPRAAGPVEMRPVGETEFVNGVASHERERHLRQDQALRRHCRPCGSHIRQSGRAGARRPHPRRRWSLSRHPPHRCLGCRRIDPQSGV